MTVNSNTLSRSMVEMLVRHFDEHPPTEFAQFLDAVPEVINGREVDNAIMQYLNSPANLDAGAWQVVFRLLGIYARCRYRKEIIRDLESIVNLDTSATQRPQHENPAIHEAGKRIESIATRLGMEFSNHGNYMFQVDLPANTPGNPADAAVFGLLTHCDVVPVNKEDWKCDPFTLKQMQLDALFPDEESVPILYARGTEDDKCSIISALYAMHAIRDTGMPVPRGIRLLIETTEESSGAGIAYLKSHAQDQIPEYNIVLDADYPVVSAESGDAAFSALFPVVSPQEMKAEVVSMHGGAASNQIPQSAGFSIRFPASTDRSVKHRIDSVAEDFITGNQKQNELGGNILKIQSSWSTRSDADLHLDVTVTGVSAHSSEPATGLNPVPRALLFMHELASDGEINLATNHFTRAAKYAADLFGFDYLGRQFGVAYKDNAGESHPPDMGPLLMSLTMAGEAVSLPASPEKQYIQVMCDVRNPRGNLEPGDTQSDTRQAARKSAQKLVRDIEKKLDDYDPEIGIIWDPEDPVSTMAWMWVSADAPWMSILLDVFNGVMRDPGKTPFGPTATPGSTTAKELPEAVNFGPALGDLVHPSQKYMGHNADEYKRLENFYLDLQLITEVVLRVSNADRLG